MISVAIQKGNYVYAYNEKNVQLFTRQGDLYGFTSSTVAIRRDKYIYVFNEKGVQISVRHI